MNDVTIRGSRLRFACMLLAAVLPSASHGVLAQGVLPPSAGGGSATKSFAFEVVSIRQNKSGGPPGHFGPTPNGFNAINLPLVGLIQMAYAPSSEGEGSFFRGDRISGVPDWLRGDERYDVEARVPESELAEWHKPASQPAMLRAMMQELLVDRCRLMVHRERKEVPVYALVIAKSGPNLKSAETIDPSELRTKHPGAVVIPGGTVIVPGPRPGQINFFAAPMSSLIPALAGPAGRPIEDHTGLTGRYDFTLQWDQSQPPAASQPEATPPTEAGPSIFTALQEQLGLRLDSAKGSVETLVIDHVERPSEN